MERRGEEQEDIRGDENADALVWPHGSGRGNMEEIKEILTR